MIWRIRKYIKHLFYLGKRKGHGIHSPYLFDFVNKVVFNGAGIKVPGELVETHRKLKKDQGMIPVTGPGAASRVDTSSERSVASFVRGSSVTEKYGALLYRIVHWFKPDVILELGTGLGLSTLYLASGYPDVSLYSIEGNEYRASFARQLISDSKPGSIRVYCGEMDEKLEELLPMVGGRFVAFMDGNHRREATLNYARKLIEHAGGQAGEYGGEEAVLIVDDIYWSKEMNQAWKEIISWPEVKVSVDLFQVGILLLRSDLAKADIKIKF